MRATDELGGMEAVLASGLTVCEMKVVESG